MSNIFTGYLQSLGADLNHISAQSAAHIVLPTVQAITIIGVVVGVGLIAYDVISKKKKKQTVKELAEEVRRHQTREELDQIDRQNNERDEHDDRYTPANIKRAACL